MTLEMSLDTRHHINKMIHTISSYIQKKKCHSRLDYSDLVLILRDPQGKEVEIDSVCSAQKYKDFLFQILCLEKLYLR